MSILFTPHPSGGASAALQQGGPTAAKNSVSKPAQEFESILLNQWLQEAQSSLGSVPGGDDESDSEGDQMKGLGTQQLANYMSASGGLGIGRMLDNAMHGSQNISSDSQRTGTRGVQSLSLDDLQMNSVAFSSKTGGGDL